MTIFRPVVPARNRSTDFEDDRDTRRQVALPDTLVKRADQTPLTTQSDNLVNLVKTECNRFRKHQPASKLKEQIRLVQAAKMGQCLKDGDATEADIDAK